MTDCRKKKKKIHLLTVKLSYVEVAGKKIVPTATQIMHCKFKSQQRREEGENADMLKF